jgi:hypothetical protein
MATCPAGRYRDGKRAVELAEKAVALEDDASVLESLAAAEPYVTYYSFSRKSGRDLTLLNGFLRD